MPYKIYHDPTENLIRRTETCRLCRGSGKDNTYNISIRSTAVEDLPCISCDGHGVMRYLGGIDLSKVEWED